MKKTGKEGKSMKRLISLLLAVCSLIGIVGVRDFVRSKADGEEKVYEADLSKGLPSDWTQYSRSDRTNLTSIKVVDNKLELGHSQSASTNEGLYSAGAYKIATSLSNVSDFTLEFSYRVVSAAANDNWIGIGYHMQEDSLKYVSGYMMGYSENGTVSQSTVQAERSASKYEIRYTKNHEATTGFTHNGEKFRTVKIVVNGSHVVHYVDGVNLLEYELGKVSSTLGYSYDNGGFVLFLHKTTVQIASVKISGYKEDGESKKTEIRTPLTLPPVVASEIRTQSDYDDIASLPETSTAIFFTDGENVLTEKGERIDTVQTVYENTKKKVMVAFRLTENNASALSSWVKSQKSYLDIAVVCDDLEVLSSFRANCPSVRGYADYSSVRVRTDEEKLAVVHDATAAKANVAILSASDATKETVDYIQSRLMTVWVRSDSENSFDQTCAILSGAFGIVTAHPLSVLATIDNCTASPTPMSRVPLNIAHRGLCFKTYENTIEAFKQAYENGATHIEIDVYVTSDGEVIVSHDDKLTRVTGVTTGTIGSMTYAQIQKLKVIKNSLGATVGEGVPVATLEDVFKEFENTDLIIIMEVKDGSAPMVRRFEELIKKYDVMDQLFAIGFGSLDDLQKKVPTLPVSWLGNSPLMNFEEMAKSNRSADTSGSDLTAAKNFAKRGYMSFFWTYDYEQNILNAWKEGTYGITNNSADALKNYAKTLNVTTSNGNYLVAKSFDSVLKSGTQCSFVDYLGNKTTAVGKVAFYEEGEGYFDVIFSCKYTAPNGFAYTLFAEPIRFVEKDNFVKLAEIVSYGEKTVDDFKTQADVDALGKAVAACSYLTEDDRATVDYEKLAKLYDDLMKNPPVDTSEDTSDTSGMSEESVEITSESASEITSESVGESVSVETSSGKSGCGAESLAGVAVLPIMFVLLGAKRKKFGKEDE